MRVLRRILAMRAAHAGWPGPGLPSRASAAMWWAATVAPCSHSSHRRLRSRWISSLYGVAARVGAGSWMIARRSREGYPAESRYQVRFALAAAPGFEAGPYPGIGGDFGLVTGRHLGDGGLVLGW